MNYDTAHQLAREIEQSEEGREYRRLKEIVEQSDTTRALLKEYRRSQMLLQVASLNKTQLPQEEMTRFSQLSSLLYAGTDTSAFLLAEMRLQQMMADIFGLLTKASGIPMELPGLS